MSNQKTKILVFDCETGGLDPQNHTCLSMAFVVADLKTGKISDRLYIELKEPPGPNGESTYHVTGKALSINNIDLKKHYEKALVPEDAVGKINDFVKKNFKKERPVLAGHNVPFDIGFLKYLYTKVGANYESFFHYHYQDTLPILRFLVALGIVPGKACTLGGARLHFGIKSKKGSKAHHALTDCEDTAVLFSKLVECLTHDDEEDDGDTVERQKQKPKKSKRKSKKNDEESEEKVELDDEDEQDDESQTVEELKDDEEGDEDNDLDDEDGDDEDDDLDDWDDEEDD